MFVKRDDAGGGGANRGGGGGDGGGGDGSQGNDRKQLKGGESESRTSSTRQPHASSPPLLRPEPTKHVHLGQLASGRQASRRPRDRLLERVSSLRGIDESSVGGDARYQTITVVSLLQSRDRRQSDIGSF